MFLFIGRVPAVVFPGELQFPAAASSSNNRPDEDSVHRQSEQTSGQTV